MRIFAAKFQEYSSIEKKHLNHTSVRDVANIVFSIFLSDAVVRIEDQRGDDISSLIRNKSSSNNTQRICWIFSRCERGKVNRN